MNYHAPEPSTTPAERPDDPAAGSAGAVRHFSSSSGGPPPPRSSRLRRWSGAAREVAILVVGILIAFALDAWWDAHRRALAYETQLRGLHREFTANRALIDLAAARHGNIAARSRALLSVLQLQQVGSEMEVSDSLLGSVFEWRTQGWSTGNIEALIASGGLQQVADAELRAMLADWPAQVDEVDEDQTMGRDFVYAVAVPELSRYADVAHLVDPAPKRSTASSVVRVTPELKAIVAARVAHAELTVGSLRVFARQVDSVLVRIQRRLPAREER